MTFDAYDRLMALLAEHDVAYAVIDHAPEGRTEFVSRMRGHDVMLAAKCIILMVKIGKKTTRYMLAVIPGGTKIDFDAIKRDMNATYVSFATAEIAERLSGAVMGTVLPFALTPELQLVVDPSLLEREDMYFNAGRLDRSIVIKTLDYAAVAKPRLARIAKAAAL